MSKSPQSAAAFLSPSRAAMKTLRSALPLILLLQLPEASSDVLDKVFSGTEPSWGTLLTLFPYFCVASTATSALTYAAVETVSRGERPAFPLALRAVLTKWKTLLPVSLLLGALFLAGFVAAVFPCIYLMTLFLFVPQLVIAESPLPWSVYFVKSKKLVKKAFTKTLVAVTLFFTLNLSLFFADGLVDRFSLRVTGDSAVQFTLSLCLSVVLSVILGAIVNTWIAHYFLCLREKQG